MLRSDGTAERAVFIVDKAGFIRYIEVADIDVRPNLAALMTALATLNSQS